MRIKATFNAVLMVLFNCALLTASFGFVSAQTNDTQQLRMENFGWSLHKIGEKKAKSQNELQKTDTADDDEMIFIKTDLIVNEVLVFDKKGLPINGLKKEDFIIEEDGQRQEIEVFSTGDSNAIPRLIVLIIDYSDSQLPYIKTSVEAAKVLVDCLNPKDRMAIVTDDVKLLQDFTSDKTALKDKLESLKKRALSGTTGLSRQYSALMAVLNEMFDEEALRPIIIFQTDGDELAQLRGEVANSISPNLKEINFSYKDVLTALEKTRATVYTIIPGRRFVEIPEDEKLKKAMMYLDESEKAIAEMRNISHKPDKIKVNKKQLKFQAESLCRLQAAIAEIAKYTGGWTDYLEEPEQADKAYAEILSGMNRRYLIGYYPTNQAQNRKRREIKTQVPGHRKYTVWGRKSYILSKREK